MLQAAFSQNSAQSALSGAGSGGSATVATSGEKSQPAAFGNVKPSVAGRNSGPVRAHQSGHGRRQQLTVHQQFGKPHLPLLGRLLQLTCPQPVRHKQLLACANVAQCEAEEGLRVGGGGAVGVESRVRPGVEEIREGREAGHVLPLAIRIGRVLKPDHVAPAHDVG